MHALIAEDEPHLAVDLERRVQRLWPELHISVVHDGLAARDYLNATPPDMAFLDIRMPGLSGLEAALAAPAGCRVVFVTAYDEHAVAAFEQAATDYLLKPVSDARLEKSLARLRQAKPTGDTQAILASTRSLLDQLREQLSVTAASDRYLSLLRVQVGLDLQLIPVEDVSHFLATEKYTTAYTRQREYLLRTPIKDLKPQLDPELFWQVHRGTLVNVRQIASARRDAFGRLYLVLHDRPDQIAVSRGYMHLFRQM